MTSRKILVPALASSSSVEIARDSFWLARNDPAELCIVEIGTPVGFFKWLFTPVTRMLKKIRGSQAEAAQRKARNRESFACQIDEVEAPSLVIGIVEAARWKAASTVVILPEVADRLGAAGLRELKNRLSEISAYVLIRVSKQGSVRVEPCGKKRLFEANKIVPIDKHRWVV